MTDGEYYDLIIEQIKTLPIERKHIFLFGERQEYSRISYVYNRLTRETTCNMEFTNPCNCPNLWNIVITVNNG